MTKIAGSGSISQKHGSEDPDPDPPQNVMNPEHCWEVIFLSTRACSPIEESLGEDLPGLGSYIFID
jgi:hypothetical protein